MLWRNHGVQRRLSRRCIAFALLLSHSFLGHCVSLRAGHTLSARTQARVVRQCAGACYSVGRTHVRAI